MNNKNNNNDIIDVNFVIKSILNNWIIGLIIFIITISAYVYIERNDAKKFVYTRIIDGMSLYQKMILTEVNNKIKELQAYDRDTFLTKQISSFSHLNTNQRNSINQFFLQRKSLTQQSKDEEDKKNILIFDEKYISFELVSLINSKKFFIKVIDEYKELNPDKLQLIDQIYNPNAFLTIDDWILKSLQEYTDKLIKIEVKFTHPTQHDILKDFSDYFLSRLNQELINKIISYIDLTIFTFEQNIQSEIEITKDLNKSITKNYKDYLDNKTTLLNKNIQIARKMNLEKPLTINDVNITFENFEQYFQNMHSFLLGYEILESELNLANEMKGLNMLIPDLVINNNYIDALNNVTLVRELKDYLKKTNISKFNSDKKTFKIVNSDSFNSSRTIFQKDINVIRIVAFFIFIFLYIFISLIISISRKKTE
tara:strand:- start:4878 stop:6152 length:1275 start_codon:yes stop_codon:yes gene_type:complete